MRFISVGDLHNKLASLPVAKIFFEYLFKFIEEKDPEKKKDIVLVFLGDIYDVKGLIRVEVQNFFYSWLNKLSSRVESIHIVVGNHDFTNLNLVDHAFNFGWNSLFSSLYVHDSPSGKGNLVFLPYMPNDKFVEAFNEVVTLHAKEDSIVFCHQAFTGFVLNANSGLIEKDGVDTNKLVKVKKIIAGHFHSFQVKDNLIYLGVPFAHSFNEANEKKFILYYDGESFKKCNVSEVTPQYLTFETTLANLLNSPDWKYSENDHVKFVIKDTEENCGKVTKQILEGLMPEKIPLCKNIYLQYDITDSAISMEIDENKDAVSMFTEWMELFYKDSPDKERALNLGKTRYLTSE